MSAETVRAINLADRIGLPQAGLFTSVSEVVLDVRARLDGHRLDNETIDQLRAVVDVALNVSDSNYRRLEESLRKSGWIAGADEVQVLRNALVGLHADGDDEW